MPTDAMGDADAMGRWAAGKMGHSLGMGHIFFCRTKGDYLLKDKYIFRIVRRYLHIDVSVPKYLLCFFVRGL